MGKRGIHVQELPFNQTNRIPDISEEELTPTPVDNPHMTTSHLYTVSGTLSISVGCHQAPSEGMQSLKTISES